MKKTVKKLSDNYRSPTPKWARVIGDTLLTLGTGLTALGIAQSNDTFAYISLGSTVLGKFLTNLFK